MKDIQLSDTDAAYIAGILDGEGSFIIGKHRSKTKHCSTRGFNWELRITVGMTETPALDFIKEIYQKKRLRVSNTKSGKICYYITLYSNEIRQTLPKLMLYLKVKKRQAELLMKAVSIIGPKRDICVDADLETLFNELKHLNKKGRRPLKESF